MRNLAKTLMMIALSGAFAAACGDDSTDADGSADGGGTGGGGGNTDGAAGSDGGGTDGGGSVTYKYVVVYDREKIDCSLTTGPGSDIDAIELQSGGTTVGVGKTGSALYGKGDMECTKCGMSMGACGHTGDAEKANVEGKPDAMIYKSKSDTGYISLNTGSIQVQIGDASGGGAAKDIKKGDIIKVYEVDLTYKDTASDPDKVCTCAPEKYEVFVFGAKADGSIDDKVFMKLNAGAPDAKNKAVCDMMSMMPSEGCGTTSFAVP